MPKGTDRPKKYSFTWFREKARHPEVAPWLLFAALLALGLVLEIFHRFPFHVPWVISTIGWLFVTLSIFVVWAAQVFLTEADHDKGPERLKTWGLYSYSRNPMYLGYIVFFLGLGVGAGSGWFILIGAWTGPVLSHYVIRHEEAVLRKEYGERYDAYMKKTRRWL